MDKFPKFMRHPANKIARSSQATPGVEGYVFDGANGTQMAFWTCAKTASSAEHVHDYDENMVVVQGCYTLIINGQRIQVKAGRNTSSHGASRTVVRLWLGPERSTHSEAIGPIASRNAEIRCSI